MEVPQHIGIIMDGNRRWAKEHKLKAVWQGHEAGARTLENVLTWCKELGVQEVTLYALSLENFNRPQEEVAKLMEITRKEFKQLLTKEKQDYRIRIIGRTQEYPTDIQELMQQLIKQTAEKGPYTVNFAMAYDGRAEIVDAVKKIAEDVRTGEISIKDINEKTIEQRLYSASQPDLIIRTSGEQRISGFLLWQASYAELYFSPKMWPEFKREDLVAAITTYSERKRRFGK